MKYVVVYRCSLCGNLISLGLKDSQDCSIEEAKKYFLSRCITFGNMSPRTQFQEMYPLQMIHNCNDGSVGIANLVGLMCHTPEDELN